MMVTDFRCWWQNYGDFFNVINRSPTSWISHQNLKLVTNTFGLQHPSPTSMYPSWSPRSTGDSDDGDLTLVTTCRCGWQRIFWLIFNVGHLLNVGAWRFCKKIIDIDYQNGQNCHHYLKVTNTSCLQHPSPLTLATFKSIFWQDG